MAGSFATSVGSVEVVVHEASRIVSLSRLGADGRPVASRMCDWNTGDLAQELVKMKVPTSEAREIAEQVKGEHSSLTLPPPQPAQFSRPTEAFRPAPRLECAGISLRFVAVLLDSIIVFIPLGIVVALMFGGGHAETGPGYANAGVDLGGDVTLFLFFLSISYYVIAEALTGMTLGKRIVGIRVVDENGDPVGFGAAVVRNLLRLVDALFLYLVGALFALASTKGQRIGDRAARTIVVRR